MKKSLQLKMSQLTLRQVTVTRCNDTNDSDGNIQQGSHKGPDLSVVIPTFNEKDNIVPLVNLLSDSLNAIHWEAIFVDDDSADGTYELLCGLARANSRIRCIQRMGRRGLTTACVEGMLASSAPYLAVMDGDLQHDEKKLPKMFDIISNEEVDIVIGSRYVSGGGTGDWRWTRLFLSKLGTKASRSLMRLDISDPMSGFFMLRRDVLESSKRNLSGIGFKILFDILASTTKELKLREVPYVFGSRVAGKSKLDVKVSWQFIMLLLDKGFGKFIPVRFIAFSVVGGFGVLIHMLVLSFFYNQLNAGFVVSQSLATLTAMICNYGFNNILTYQDRRLLGTDWIKGLFTFVVACSIGALANIGIATYLFSQESKLFLAAIVGIVVGAVWNYAVTSFYVWNK